MANLFDARDRKIPNELILLGYAAGLYQNVQRFQWFGLVLFIIKAVMPILLLMLLFLFRSFGAGDIKLCSVMCTLVGFECTSDVMITSVMVAAVAVLLLFIYEKEINLKRRLPYSFFMSVAFFLHQIME